MLRADEIWMGSTGQQHKRQRKMLNPVFSTKHLREMTPIFYEVMQRVRFPRT